MIDRPRYTLDDDIAEAEAEAAARDLPEQIARIRAQVRLARTRLTMKDDDAGADSQLPSD